MRSPTGLTLDYLRRQGWLADVVERWLPKVDRRRDLFGIADVFAVQPVDRLLMLVQATSDSNVSSRVAKIQGRPETPALLRAGVVVEVWGWSRRGGRWDVRRVAIRAADLSAVPMTPNRRRRSRTVQRTLFGS